MKNRQLDEHIASEYLRLSKKPLKIKWKQGENEILKIWLITFFAISVGYISIMIVALIYGFMEYEN